SSNVGDPQRGSLYRDMSVPPPSLCRDAGGGPRRDCGKSIRRAPRCALRTASIGDGGYRDGLVQANASNMCWKGASRFPSRNITLTLRPPCAHPHVCRLWQRVISYTKSQPRETCLMDFLPKAG